eukprot:TRINITY_DN63779_c0_g1_i1.p1 TRINITY_DN63779_c0_g1~~TRINITY_DN63779_c0_g1_i1.p1  ORF type:complete len:634 (+),score=123.29 TRINITY_DN63779_c0_g1_i1:125-2026(+)
MATPLERENRLLQAQVFDLRHLLQVKDVELELKHRLLRAREIENAQTLARLRWLEQALGAAAAAAAATAPAGSEAKLLATGGAPPQPATAPPTAPPKGPPNPAGGSVAAEALKTHSAPPAGASPVIIPPGLSATTSDSDAFKTPQKRSPKADPGPSPEPSPSAQPASGGSAASDSKTGAVDAAAVAAGSRKVPPELELNEAQRSGQNADGLPNRSPAGSDGKGNGDPKGSPPATPSKATTPSKRMAIVDPTSGKEIEVTPHVGQSTMKPTLVSLDTICERPARQAEGAAGGEAPRKATGEGLALATVPAGTPPPLHGTTPGSLQPLLTSSPPLNPVAAPGLLGAYGAGPGPGFPPTLPPGAVPPHALGHPPALPPGMVPPPLGAPGFPPGAAMTAPGLGFSLPVGLAPPGSVPPGHPGGRWPPPPPGMLPPGVAQHLLGHPPPGHPPAADPLAVGGPGGPAGAGGAVQMARGPLAGGGHAPPGPAQPGALPPGAHTAAAVESALASRAAALGAQAQAEAAAAAAAGLPVGHGPVGSPHLGAANPLHGLPPPPLGLPAGLLGPGHAGSLGLPPLPSPTGAPPNAAQSLLGFAGYGAPPNAGAHANPLLAPPPGIEALAAAEAEGAAVAKAKARA